MGAENQGFRPTESEEVNQDKESSSKEPEVIIEDVLDENGEVEYRWKTIKGAGADGANRIQRLDLDGNILSDGNEWPGGKNVGTLHIKDGELVGFEPPEEK